MVYSKNINKYFDELLDFYQPRFEENYKKVLKNSQIICFCKKNDVVVGVGRVVTDMVKNAMIFDLIVKKSERNQGIGSEIMKKIIKECKKNNIKNICLTTDPRSLWLVDYYKKLGFQKLNKGYFMVYKKRL